MDKMSTRAAAAVLEITLPECLIFSFALPTRIFSMRTGDPAQGTVRAGVYTSGDM